jgi:hypothetical protein
VFIVSQFEPIGPVVEALTASDAAEWCNQIRLCLPYRHTCFTDEMTGIGRGGRIPGWASYRAYLEAMSASTVDVVIFSTDN